MKWKKTLKKETEGDAKKQKHLPCSQTHRINSVEMFILSKAIYNFNKTLFKIPMQFFRKIEKNLEIYMETYKK